MKWTIISAALLLNLQATTVVAKEFVVTYDGFFDRMKTLQKPEYNQIEMAFFVQDIGSKQPCLLKDGQINSETDSQPLLTTELGELLLPYDKALKDAKAVLVAQTVNPDHQCQLQLQMQAKIVKKTDYQVSELRPVQQQFDEALADMSGWLLRFITPDVSGVTFVFSAPATATVNGQAQRCEGNKCMVDLRDIEQGKVLLTAEPLRIVPYVAK